MDKANSNSYSNSNSNSNSDWRQRFRPGTRRLVQLYSALLYNAHLRGFIDGDIYSGKAKYACVPGFNCYSCPGAVGACPLGAIQNALAGTGHQAGWYVLGMITLFGVVFGRTICGWLCPLGLIQELLHKIPTLKIRKSRVTRALTWLKYILLAVFVTAIPLWYGLIHNMPLPGFCKYICPAGTLEGAMGLLSNPANTAKFSMLGILFTRKFVIMLLIGLLCVFCYRTFCRFICPLGAIYGLFNRFNVIGVEVDRSRCSGCGSCVRSCGMDVRHVGDHECINCGRCIEVCARNAISIRAGSFTVKAPAGMYADSTGCSGNALSSDSIGHSDGTGFSEGSGYGHSALNRKRFARICWGAALCFLCLALLWFNFLDPTVRKRSAEKPAPAQPVVNAPASPDLSPAGKEKKEGNVASSEAAVGETPSASSDLSSEAKEGDAVYSEMNPLQPEMNALQAEMTTDEAESAMEAAPANGSGNIENSSPFSYESSAPIGYEVGQQLADFTTPTFDGTGFHLAETRGKIVFINLWGTYCTPCVQELPDFEALLREHEGEAAMLAVHSSLTAEVEPQDYVREKGWEDWLLPFALDDEEKDTIFTIVNGSSTLPQTIVLNRRGEVIYNQVGSVTPGMLEALYKKADESAPAVP